MPADSSPKASDTYDSLYLSHFLVVVPQHLAFDATGLHFPLFTPGLLATTDLNSTTTPPIRDLELGEFSD